MAKQIGAYRFIGTMGNTTGFKNRNAKKAGSAFVREKAAQVSNPKTYAQATQRAKARPAAIFYNAFASVLNHAYLPSDSESKNRLRFMSLALKNEVPWVFKGENIIPINVPYQVSEGSLGLQSLCKATHEGTGNDSSALRFPNIITPAAWTDDASDIADLTIAEFTAQLLALNPQLTEGLELTFMGVLVNETDYADRLAAHFSIVLNAGDTLTKVSDVMGRQLMLASFASGDVNTLAISTPMGGYGLACGALIISSKTTSSWVYTTSFLARTAFGIDSFDNDADVVIRSYMDTASDFSSAKVLQQADNSIVGGVVPVSGTNAQYTYNNAPAGATFNYANAAVVTMSDGSRRVVVAQNGSLVNYDAGFEPVQITVDGSTNNVRIADTSWSGVPTITEQEAAGVPFQQA